jgi:hypothetical protein
LGSSMGLSGGHRIHRYTKGTTTHNPMAIQPTTSASDMGFSRGVSRNEEKLVKIRSN